MRWLSNSYIPVWFFFMSKKFKLAELCLSKCYFLWNNEIRIPRPIELSFMVVFSESCVQNLEHRAIAYRWNVDIINLQFKLYSCMLYGTITNILKGFLARATKICSEKYFRVEIGYLTENG